MHRYAKGGIPHPYIHQQYSVGLNGILPIKTSGKEAAARRCCQQCLGFSKFGTSQAVISSPLFFIDIWWLECIILIPLIWELPVDNGCSIKVPNACNQIGRDCPRESLQRLLFLGGIILGIGKNRLEALGIRSLKCGNALVKCRSCAIPLEDTLKKTQTYSSASAWNSHFRKRHQIEILHQMISG